MSDSEKINIVLNEIQSVYGLTENTKNMLKDNIIKRASMYNGITPNINPEESSVIINPTSTVDVFLNRLVNNIRVYNLSNSYTSPNQLVDKGTYTDGSQTLRLESYNSIKDSIIDKFNSKGVSISNEQLDICVRKVFNHEIGHALQHSFKGNDGMINNNYNIVVSNLAQKYPNMFQVPNKIQIQQINGGVKPKESNIYSKLDKQSTLLDEIFNESEALEISNMKNSQFEYNMKHGNKKIYNYDSSNYKITSYGNMMKIIMGNEKTYRAMYEDSDIIYNFFDQFKDISKEVFKTNDTTTPMHAILIGFDHVRNKSNMDVANDLDLFFTKCLEKRVYHDLKNPNISSEEISRITNYIEKFQNQMIKSPHNNLQQEIIINNIKELTKKRSNELNKEELVVNKENKINIKNSENFMPKENLNKSQEITNQTNLSNQKKEDYEIMIDFVYNACNELSNKKYDGNRKKLLQDLLNIYRETLKEMSTEDEFKYVSNKFFSKINSTVAGMAIYEDLYNIFIYEKNKKLGKTKSDVYNDTIIQIIQSLEQTYDILINKYNRLIKDKQESKRPIDDYDVSRLFKQFSNLKKDFDDKRIMAKYVELNKFDTFYDIIQNIDIHVDKLKKYQNYMEESTTRMSL